MISFRTLISLVTFVSVVGQTSFAQYNNDGYANDVNGGGYQGMEGQNNVYQNNGRRARMRQAPTDDADIDVAANDPEAQDVAAVAVTANNKAGLGEHLEMEGIKNCGDVNDIMIVDTLALHPYPPVRGAKLNVTVVGTVQETVLKGAKYRLTTELGYKKKKRTKNSVEDLCDPKTATFGLNCPIDVGPQVINYDIDVPKNLPKGTYSYTVEVMNGDNRRIACVQGTVPM